MFEFKVCTEINQAFLNFCGFQDSLIKPITRILVGVAVLTALIVLVMKETPEWAKKLNITVTEAVMEAVIEAVTEACDVAVVLYDYFKVPPLDIATATKPQLDKALETLAPYTKEAVIAYGRFLVQVFVEEPLKKHDIRKARAAKELATALLALPVLVHEAIWNTLLPYVWYSPKFVLFTVLIVLAGINQVSAIAVHLDVNGIP
ncbi:hypothetical protein Tco_1119812 [Tanacetum coccineum]